MVIIYSTNVLCSISGKRHFGTSSFFRHMLVTYGPLFRESIEADEAAEESRLLPGNCYFLGVLKGVERTLHRRAGEDRG